MTADSPIPCIANAELRKRIETFAEVLKTEAHKLGDHGLDENEFYNSGLFRGAVERIRGQFIASMSDKREFVRNVLNYMQDKGAIKDWHSAGESNRHDYVVELFDGTKSAIELKGCLDGNNTNIFERPPHVNEFIIWSICSNPGADPAHNAWSGIHTRLSAEIISRSQVVDGLMIWDWACGTIGRPCPKVAVGGAPVTVIGPYELPPPCIYLFPATIPAPRNNPSPVPQTIDQVGLLKAFHTCFGGNDQQLHQVGFAVEYQGVETVRTTTITRNGIIAKQSGPSPIKRT